MLVESQKRLKRCLAEIDFNSQCTYINTLLIHYQNRLRFPYVILSSFSITLDPNIRYTLWSILIGNTFFEVAMYACTQTQAQRYMCVKDTKAAQKYFWNQIYTNYQFYLRRVVWINYAMNLVMQILWICVGCLIYVKYNQCDPLKAKLISKSDQVG
jgi:hypothetical protein